MSYGYRRSRDLHGSGVRTFGWVIALPVALFAGPIVGVASGSAAWGMGVGACVALFGLAIVSFGYLVGAALGGYFPRLALAAAIPIGALSWAIGSGYAWVWSVGWTILGVVLFGIGRGFVLHHGSNNSWLIADIFRGFAPRN
ncbi:MAG TPA: hypothetical protein VJM32_03275 [Candidatus Saccharimonadales bacterium]|nr:hypothetical protein [Candidatus Saccharimonadales bacterium]